MMHPRNPIADLKDTAKKMLVNTCMAAGIIITVLLGSAPGGTDEPPPLEQLRSIFADPDSDECFDFKSAFLHPESISTHTHQDLQVVYDQLLINADMISTARPSVPMHPTAEDLRAGIQRAVERFPLASGLCGPCALEIYTLFTNEGFSAQIGHMENESAQLTLADGTSLSSGTRGTSNFSYHEFTRVGNIVYDAITGSGGMLWEDYQALFKAGSFDDPSLRLFYCNPFSERLNSTFQAPKAKPRP